MFIQTITAQNRIVSQEKQLNVVLFIADDLGVNDIEPYGNKIVRTPNLSKLASQSMLFRRAFAASPTCSPSRSTILTGLMPVRSGAHDNHSGVKPGTRSIVQYLQPDGYRVAIAGKYHIAPDTIFSFERISKTNVPEPGFSKNPGLNYDLDLNPVDEWLSKQNNSPFFLVVADHSPHVVWPEKSTYAEDSVDIPVKHIDTRQTRLARTRYYTDITKLDSNVGKVMQSIEKYGFAENTLFIFIADQGPQWPFAKWSLYDDGIKTPMIIRWPGVVKPGSKTNALVSLCDLLPTILEVTSTTTNDELDGKSFLSVLTGKSTSHHEFVFATHTGDGTINRSPSRMVRTIKYKYILNLAPDTLYSTHMDVAKDHDGGREYWNSWKERSLTDSNASGILRRYHHRPLEEFYDIDKDPDELNNLAGNSSFTSIINKYRLKLAEWRKQQNDSFRGNEVFSNPAGQKPVAPYVFIE